MFKSQREVIQALANGETLVSKDRADIYSMLDDGSIEHKGAVITVGDLPHFSTLKIKEPEPFKNVNELVQALLGGEKIRYHDWTKGEFISLVGGILIDEIDRTFIVDDIIDFDEYKDWYIFR